MYTAFINTVIKNASRVFKYCHGITWYFKKKKITQSVFIYYDNFAYGYLKYFN